LGGELVVTSAEGGGTTLFATIPLDGFDAGATAVSQKAVSGLV
jgi:hypothetical protein